MGPIQFLVRDAFIPLYTTDVSIVSVCWHVTLVNIPPAACGCACYVATEAGVLKSAET